MKKRTKILIATAGVVSVVGGLAIAGGHVMAGGWDRGGKHGMGGMRGAAMFERFDANGDDRVTRAEMAAFQDGVLAKHDADGNGAINLEEFQAVWLDHMRPRMVDGFQRLDDDGDGAITKAEIDMKLDRMMRWMDRNDNGSIEFREMRKMHKGYRGHGRYDDDDDDDDRS